jgi:amino acid transporter
LLVAVVFNIVGLNIGKWLQNAGGVATYLPLLILTAIAGVLWFRNGSVTHFTASNVMPVWNWDTVNFWSQIAFAFTGLELVSAMSQEIHNPRRTLPRAALTAAALIAGMYIVGTLALLSLVPAAQVDPKSGVFHGITVGSAALHAGFIGILAALLVTVGNAGGVGSTVAGIARVPFVVGIDRYLPAAFGKIHPKWKTPYISIIVQAIASGLVLLLSQINETTRGAYQVVIDITIIIYFIPFLYMFAAAVKLASRPDRQSNPQAVLIPGGRLGVWICSALGFFVTALSIVVSMLPPGDSADRELFIAKVVGCSIIAIGLGLILYFRGARSKRQAVAEPAPHL